MDINQIKESVLDFIERGNSDDFPEMALKIYKFQFNENEDYKKFSISKGKTPQNVSNWKEIPAVPINAFKYASFSAIPLKDTKYTYMTSGTTSGIKGKNYHMDLEVYDLALTTFFKKMFIPDIEKIKIGVLFPTPQAMPNSSLAHYLEVARTNFGTKDSQNYIDEHGIQYESLIKDLKNSEDNQKPFALLGATYSMVHLLEYLDDHNIKFHLPKGSRILDTGGYKNRSKELPQHDFYERLTTTFGIPKENCVNMYGVTELSTQFYDKGNTISPSTKYSPHWCRSRIVNPLTMEEVSEGEKGILIHYDLANYNSVAAILMEDIGEYKEKGFVLHGRTKGSLAKGCSLAMEDFLNATQ